MYKFDIRSRLPLSAFTDEGSFDTTAIALNSEYLAAGQQSGIVNLYSLKTSETKP